ncbi:hypothetical protein [Dactylosporangium sp. CA-233914]|uniref:hypothetical protein n=1 Tax=Dactylosporangium sp. CA-233914 TaxID=3239934 RepID=UPI003D90B9F5
MAHDEVLAGRLRDRAGVAEKRMSGGVAVLGRGDMTVGVIKDDLLVRLAAGEAEAAGVRPFRAPARLGRRRRPPQRR